MIINVLLVRVEVLSVVWFLKILIYFYDSSLFFLSLVVVPKKKGDFKISVDEQSNLLIFVQMKNQCTYF